MMQLGTGNCCGSSHVACGVFGSFMLQYGSVAYTLSGWVEKKS